MNHVQLDELYYVPLQLLYQHSAALRTRVCRAVTISDVLLRACVRVRACVRASVVSREWIGGECIRSCAEAVIDCYYWQEESYLMIIIDSMRTFGIIEHHRASSIIDHRP